MLKQVQHDNRMRQRGFTLIELLVVVLIIGILAAVAVPQYQKAVWKSRFAQAKTMAESLAQAEEIYYLANGSYTRDINELSIDVSATSCGSSSGQCFFSWGYCSLVNPYNFVRCYVYKNGASYLRYDHWLDNSEYPRLRQCVSLFTNVNDLSNQICKAETGRSQPSGVQDTAILWSY